MRYQIETVKINLNIKESEGEKITGELGAFRVLMEYYNTLDADQEHFSILILDQKNRIRGLKTLFMGGENQVMIDKKVLFRTALLMGATGLILCHNHPSGESYPSNDDLKVTMDIKEGAKVLGLEILDHIVLGKNEFYSFKDKGLL